MRPSKTFALISALLLSGTSAAPVDCHEPSQKAIYFQTNAKEGNSIVALPIQQNGTLGAGLTYSTHGEGSAHLDMNTLQPVTPDALLSQSSVAVAGNFLFTVNAMSNSASVFRINPKNASDLYLLNTTPLPSGQFPNTIAASIKHKLVCVAASGEVNGVTCASFDHDGLGAFDTLRPLGLAQSTPPTGPPNTVSQISFTEDDKSVIVSVKADPPTNKPGFTAVYAVQGGKVAKEAVRSSPAGTSILFGFSQVTGVNDFIITDPSIGAAILSLDAQTGNVQTVKPINITSQMATCWSTISPATKTAFVADGGLNRLVEVSLPGGDIVSTTEIDNGANVGLFDMVASGGLLYALSPGNGTAMPSVLVIDAKSKKVAQNYGLGDLGVTASVVGMAVFE